MVRRHVLLITFPAQGHMNPALQLAKRLMKLGVEVTFPISLFAYRRMTKTTGGIPKGLNFEAFSDGYDDGFRHEADNAEHYMSEMRSRGSQNLRQIIAACAADHDRPPITELIYTLLLPWAAEVAHEFYIPTTLLWIQPATVLDIYYHYFHGYRDAIIDAVSDPSLYVKLPALPVLGSRDLPSFISCSNQYSFFLEGFKEQLEAVDGESSPKVLVNTFDSLEPEALKAIPNYKLIAIGPLIPSAFLDGKDPSDTSFGIDLFQTSRENYLEWLDSKAKSSVIYVSFGSILTLEKRQMKEIGKCLSETGMPFLWVIREKDNNYGEEEWGRWLEENLEKKGKIVTWCSQLEVLSHPSVGCFVTHCGWNSTLESIACGIPVVAFPHWTDQGTNAKLMEDEWRTGVRLRPSAQGTVESSEFRRCIEMVMRGGERSQELRRNAKKWKELAKAAMVEGGSSEKNLKAFINRDDI